MGNGKCANCISTATFKYKGSSNTMVTKCLNCATSRKSIEAIHKLSHTPEHKLVSDIILRIQDYNQKRSCQRICP